MTKNMTPNLNSKLAAEMRLVKHEKELYEEKFCKFHAVTTGLIRALEKKMASQNEELKRMYHAANTKISM